MGQIDAEPNGKTLFFKLREGMLNLFLEGFNEAQLVLNNMIRYYMQPFLWNFDASSSGEDHCHREPRRGI